MYTVPPGEDGQGGGAGAAASGCCGLRSATVVANYPYAVCATVFFVSVS